MDNEMIVDGQFMQDAGKAEEAIAKKAIFYGSNGVGYEMGKDELVNSLEGTDLNGVILARELLEKRTYEELVQIKEDYLDQVARPGCKCCKSVHDIKVNLCDTCRYSQPECMNDMTVEDIEYGDGKGNDNIIKCTNYDKVL